MFERVLIVNPFGIGDALFITPIIQSFREQGAEKIDLIVGKRTRELLETNPLVNQVFVFDREAIKSKSFISQLSDSLNFFSLLKKNHYNILFDLSFQWQYSFLGWLLSIPTRAGFNYKKRGRFLTHKIDLPKGYCEKHVVDYYCDLLQLLGISGLSKDLVIHLTDEDMNRANHFLQVNDVSESTSFLSVAVGGGESWGVHARLKRWPPRYFEKLIRLIRENQSVDFEKVILLGGPGEFTLAEQLVKSNPKLYLNACGKMDIRTSAAILKKSRMLIANDGGLVHLATAVKTPVAAIFGPVDPKVYSPFPPSSDRMTIVSEGPECRPCYQNMRYNSSCEHIKCLTELFPDHVFHQMTTSHFFKSALARS